MSVMVSELYEALRAAGVQEATAKAAAQAVLAADARANLASKTDVSDDLTALRNDFAELKLATRADLAELKADLIKWNVGTLIAMTAIYGGLVAMLKLFA